MKQKGTKQKKNKHSVKSSATPSTRHVVEEEGTLPSSDPSSEVPSLRQDNGMMNSNTLTANILPSPAVAPSTRPPLQDIAPNSKRSTPSTSTGPKKKEAPFVLPNAFSEAKREEEQLVTTTQNMMELVLGEVVEIVVDAETNTNNSNNNQSNLDVDRLQPLLPFQDSAVASSQDQDTMIQLSRQELQQIVMRVVVSAKASVRNGTKKPTGMHISDLGPKRVTVSLSWVNAKQNLESISASLVTPQQNVLGERVCI